MGDKNSGKKGGGSRLEDLGQKGGYQPKEDRSDLGKRGYTPKDQGGSESSELPAGGTGQSTPPVKPPDK